MVYTKIFQRYKGKVIWGCEIDVDAYNKSIIKIIRFPEIFQLVLSLPSNVALTDDTP